MVLVESRELARAERFQRWDEDFNRNCDQCVMRIALMMNVLALSNLNGGLAKLQTRDSSLYDETCHISLKTPFDPTLVKLFAQIAPLALELSPFKEWKAHFAAGGDEAEKEHVRGLMRVARERCRDELTKLMERSQSRHKIMALTPYQITCEEGNGMPLSIVFTFKRGDIQLEDPYPRPVRDHQGKVCFEIAACVAMVAVAVLFAANF
jgi:hypothetical protein